MMAFDQFARDEDARLLASYANGDQGAARLLAERHAPRVMALARRMLGDAHEAEDVAQEAMLRLWRIAPDWREGEAQIATWLYRVTANLCTDRLRKQRVVSLDQVAEPVDARPGVFEAMADADRSRALDAALQKLPERQRLAIVLRHLEERSNPEISAIMEISVEAVESLLSRGKRALVTELSVHRTDLGYGSDG